MFECVRCSRQVRTEECHLLYNRKYCRACVIFLSNDTESIKLLSFMAKYGDIEAWK